MRLIRFYYIKNLKISLLTSFGLIHLVLNVGGGLMSMVSVWWIVTGLLMIIEMRLGTWYALILALGTTCSALVAQNNHSVIFQLLIAIVTISLAYIAFYLDRQRRLMYFNQYKRQLAQRPHQHISPKYLEDLDAGQTVSVFHWDQQGRTKVKFRGREWLAETAMPGCSGIGRYQIIAVREGALILAPYRGVDHFSYGR